MIIIAIILGKTIESKEKYIERCQQYWNKMSSAQRSVAASGTVSSKPGVPDAFPGDVRNICERSHQGATEMDQQLDERGHRRQAHQQQQINAGKVAESTRLGMMQHPKQYANFDAICRERWNQVFSQYGEKTSPDRQQYFNNYYDTTSNGKQGCGNQQEPAYQSPQYPYQAHTATSQPQLSPSQPQQYGFQSQHKDYYNTQSSQQSTPTKSRNRCDDSFVSIPPKQHPTLCNMYRQIMQKQLQETGEPYVSDEECICGGGY